MMTHIIWTGEKLVPRFSIWNDYPIICLPFVFAIFIISSHPITIYICFDYMHEHNTSKEP